MLVQAFVWFLMEAYMEGSSVGRVDEYPVQPSPPPSPREEEKEPASEAPAPEAPRDSGNRLDLFA
jgi:hypothetical protein